AMGEMCIAPHQPSGQPLGIGIEQQLVGIEAMAVFGLVRTVHAIAIELAGRHVVEVTVPDILRALRQFDAFELAATLVVEQAKLDLLRMRREQREIGTAAVPVRTETREGSSGEAHASAFRN